MLLLLAELLFAQWKAAQFHDSSFFHNVLVVALVYIAQLKLNRSRIVRNDDFLLDK